MPQHELGVEVSYAKIIPHTHLLIQAVINSHAYILSRVAKLLIGYLIVDYIK